jgi:hypothetical protein
MPDCVPLKAGLVAVALALGLDVAAVDAAPPQPTPPASRITKTEAESAFAQAVFLCLGTRAGHQNIKDAPADAQADYAPASESDRAFAGGMFSLTVPMWVSHRLGYHLYIFEPSSERCEAHAVGLPVEATFDLVKGTLQKSFPELRPVPPTRDASPIAYEFEGVENGEKYIIHLGGAEAGSLGNSQSVSLLNGVVERQPTH